MALYGWELDYSYPYDFDEADTVLIERQWTTPGQYTIGLRVTDEYGATNVAWKTSDRQGTAERGGPPPGKTHGLSPGQGLPD